MVLVKGKSEGLATTEAATKDAVNSDTVRQVGDTNAVGLAIEYEAMRKAAFVHLHIGFERRASGAHDFGSFALNARFTHLQSL